MVLLDAVLVVAIIALAAYVLVPVPSATFSKSDMLAEASAVAARFRDGRVAAIRARAPVDVVVDAAAGRVEGAGEPLALDRRIDLTWLTSDQCPLDRGRRALRFLADGRSCGGVLRMKGGSHEAELRVDWLTGRVEMDLR